MGSEVAAACEFRQEAAPRIVLWITGAALSFRDPLLGSAFRVPVLLYFVEFPIKGFDLLDSVA